MTQTRRMALPEIEDLAFRAPRGRRHIPAQCRALAVATAATEAMAWRAMASPISRSTPSMCAAGKVDGHALPE